MLLTDALTDRLRQALLAAQDAHDLPAFEAPPLLVERPRDPQHGDYTSNAAMQLARSARMAPLKIAQALLRHFPPTPWLAGIEVIAPGFINFRLTPVFLQNVVNEIVQAGPRFGYLTLGAGQKVQVECVSANPTGPITLGRTRGGVIGDTLARLLRAAGYAVTLEYYYNDAGRQITLLGESVKIRYRQLCGESAELGDEHYQGDYIQEIATRILAEHGHAWLDRADEFFAEYAKAIISQQQRDSLRRINIVHDVYYNEQDLYTSGRLMEALEALRRNGYVYQTEDGAQWLRTTAFGDDQDRVLIRSVDGLPTYRLPDIAYHWHKAQRGFDLVVDIFGPDHHAVAPQVLMGVQALGFDTNFVHTLLHQIVNLIRDGERVKMSTRRGVYVTLDELIDEVGPDPIRYYMLARSPNSHVDFDLDLAVEHSDKNPVYYIQNAHVRCAGIFRKWAEAGLLPDADEAADVRLLTHSAELAFLRKALELSEVIANIAQTREPHPIAFYAYELATLFHTVYEQCRVLHSEVPDDLRLARLRFYRAAQQLLAEVLGLMGMSAPEVM